MMGPKALKEYKERLKYREIIASIKQMYEWHDASERRLVIATRKRRVTYSLWHEHDLLERAIVFAEAQLPQRIVERLKAGEL